MLPTLLQRASLFMLAFLLISPTAFAQSQADEVASPEELEKVAAVLSQIEDVRKKYRTKLRNAQDQGEIVSYQRQMTIEIGRTIDRYEGITIERYEEITEAAQADNKLKRKILTLTEEYRSKQAVKKKGR